MPGRPKRPAIREPCHCLTCNGALMSNRTIRRHLNRDKPQAQASLAGNNSEADTSGSDDDHSRLDLDFDRPTKRARQTGRESIPVVCFNKFISPYIRFIYFTFRTRKVKKM